MSKTEEAEDTPAGNAEPAPTPALGSPTAAPRSSSGIMANAPSIPPTSTTQHPAVERPISPPNQTNDPVAALQGAFPSMDRQIIAEVLAAHGGNPDAASMALLELSADAPFVTSSKEAGGATQQRPAATDGDAAAVARNAQMTADEAYARELMSQMEREHQAAYGRPLGTAPTANRQDGHQWREEDLRYQPRQLRHHEGESSADKTSDRQQGNVGQYDGRFKGQDELDQLAEQFNKLADTGKKTFNSLLEKAQAKYSEVQSQRAERQSMQSHPASTDGASSRTSGSAFQPTPGQAKSGQTTIAGYTLPAPWQGGIKLDDVKANLQNFNINDIKAKFTRPNQPQSSTSRDYTQTSALPEKDAEHSTGYPSYSAQPVRSATLADTAALAASPPATSAMYSVSPNNKASGQFSSSPAKVHMLPRQPISLLDKSGNSSTRTASIGGTAAATTSFSSNRHPTRDDDSDSDVEYVRNPFNDDD